MRYENAEKAADLVRRIDSLQGELRRLELSQNISLYQGSGIGSFRVPIDEPGPYQNTAVIFKEAMIDMTQRMIDKLKDELLEL